MIQLCHLSATAKDTATHQRVHQELDQFKQLPDYSLYVITVFFRCTNEPEEVRQIAGYLLKNYIKQASETLRANADLLNIMRQQVVCGLDAELTIGVRKTLGTIVTQLVTSSGAPLPSNT
jgi:hypothetical protein